MAFGGTMGPAANPIPPGSIINIKGEVGVSYDAAGRLRFVTPSGTIYTPERFDTMLIVMATAITPVLGPVVPGVAQPVNADVGTLVTTAPGANQHGMPTNFGPGRGKWADPTGRYPRLRVTPQPSMSAPVVPPAGLSPPSAMFFALMPGDNPAPIALGGALMLPSDGPTTGAGAPTRAGLDTFLINTPGLYEIAFQTSIDEAGQLQVWVNGAPIPGLDPSTAGRATGTSQISNQFLINLLAGDLISIRNPPGNPGALTVTPIAGGTVAVSATLVIKGLAPTGGGGGTGATGGVESIALPLGGNDVQAAVRNYNATQIDGMVLIVECLHSVQA